MKKKTLKFILEFRSRLLRYCIVLLLTSIIAIIFANPIYRFLTLPLLSHLANQQGLIAISISSPFLIPLKSALLFSVFITLPYLFYQLWAFIVPALYQQERKLGILLTLFSLFLFYFGVFFCYVIVLPLVFKFFIYVAPQGVEVKPDISQYYHFIVKMFFAFGVAFEVPVLIVLLIISNICHVQSLAEKRPYVIVAAFVIGMVLTPPDIVSQILLALPLWLLFELGLALGRYLQRYQLKITEKKI